jgi:hypothetical protein
MHNKSKKGMGSEALEITQNEIDKIKQKLQDLGIKNVELFDKGDIETQITNFLNTIDGQITQKKILLKFGVALSPTDKAKLEKEIAELEAKSKAVGNISLKIVNKDSLQNFANYGKNIMDQFKAGMDVTPQLEYMEARFIQMFERLKLQSQNAQTMMFDGLDKAIPKNADTELVSLTQKVKDLYVAFGKADTAKEAQKILNDFKNVTAEIAVKYGETASAVVSANKTMANSMQTVSDSMQNLQANEAKSFSLITGSKEVDAAMSSILKKLDAVESKSTKIKMTKDEILKKIGTGTDLTFAMRNAELSVSDAMEIEIKMQKAIAAQKTALIAMDNTRMQILQGLIKYDNAQAKAQALQDLANAQLDVINGTAKEIANLKAAGAVKSKVVKSAQKHAKAEKNTADEIERANRALAKMEAKYLAILGMSGKSAALSIEAEFSKMDEYGKKAGKSYEEMKRLKMLYLESETKTNNQNIENDAIQESGLDYLATQQKYQQRYDQMEAYYSKAEELQTAKEQLLVDARKAGDLSEIDYERQLNELKLQESQVYYDKKTELDRIYWEGMAATAGSMLTEVGGIMKSFYTSGLADSKGFYMAMQAVNVAAAIMNTYVAASNALATGIPPMNYINAAIAVAKGMAQVAQIKAQKFHTGGYAAAPNASGNGGKRDDEINAVLQKGEYVLSRTDVQLIKSANEREINSLRNQKNVPEETNNSESTSLQTRELALLAESLKSEVVIVNSADPAVVEDWATSRRGREVIKNIVNS